MDPGHGRPWMCGALQVCSASGCGMQSQVSGHVVLSHQLVLLAGHPAVDRLLWCTCLHRLAALGTSGPAHDQVAGAIATATLSSSRQVAGCTTSRVVRLWCCGLQEAACSCQRRCREVARAFRGRAPTPLPQALSRALWPAGSFMQLPEELAGGGVPAPGFSAWAPTPLPPPPASGAPRAAHRQDSQSLRAQLCEQGHKCAGAPAVSAATCTAACGHRTCRPTGYHSESRLAL